jgi:hypothetical protein
MQVVLRVASEHGHERRLRDRLEEGATIVHVGGALFGE